MNKEVRYLLDTNTCIFIINQRPKVVFEYFSKIAVGMIGISSITGAELYYGVNKSGSTKNLLALEKFLIPLEIFSFDDNAMLEYGKLRAELERKGTPIGTMDCLIAAHSLALETILVTNNTREFSRVPNLIIEDWLI